jgi:hypothetical protein
VGAAGLWRDWLHYSINGTLKCSSYRAENTLSPLHGSID